MTHQAELRQIDRTRYSVDPHMSAMIRKHHFYTWWHSEAQDRQQLFGIVNKVRRDCDVPPYDWKTFDEGWQYRTVGHERYDIARAEMFNLCWGWW